METLSFLFLFSPINGGMVKWSEGNTDLDTILDLASIVFDNEGGLHDSRELDVAIPLMLPLELIQQSLVGGLWEAELKEEKVTFLKRNILANCGTMCFLHLLLNETMLRKELCKGTFF